MSGAIPPFPEYAFMAWYSVKAQGQLYSFNLYQILTSDKLQGRTPLYQLKIYAT
jgi:hypothetical protein